MATLDRSTTSGVRVKTLEELFLDIRIPADATKRAELLYNVYMFYTRLPDDYMLFNLFAVVGREWDENVILAPPSWSAYGNIYQNPKTLNDVLNDLRRSGITLYWQKHVVKQHNFLTW